MEEMLTMSAKQKNKGAFIDRRFNGMKIEQKIQLSGLSARPLFGHLSENRKNPLKRNDHSIKRPIFVERSVQKRIASQKSTEK